MPHENKWIDLSILGLCTVALTGLVLRTKIVFAMPFINYNHLLEAHAHFTFEGWVTLILMTLMVYELLPKTFNKKRAYPWIFGGITIIAWSMLIVFILEGYNTISIILSALFILLTYIFGWIFIRDMLKAKLKSPVLLLGISSIVCLIISSSGSFIIMYIFISKSFNAILYRDAFFTYLHFQYNGFFSLAVLSLLFNQISENINTVAKKKYYQFAVVLCLSIIPSLFLSYLWQNPGLFIRLIAIVGSFLVLLSFTLFIRLTRSLHTIYHGETLLIRFLVLLSMISFMLKMILQSFTIWTKIGNAIFGNRAIIMGFLHLVFLGFVSLFILAFLTKKEFMDGSRKITIIALIVFAIAIILNEILLVSQGLATILIPGGNIFSWLLWGAAICLFAGTILIVIARIRTKQVL